MDIAGVAADCVLDLVHQPIGEPQGVALRQALAKPASLEFRRRLEQLLGKLEGVPDADQRRKLRAVAVLELAGTAAARELLAALSGGAPEARLTRESQAALQRLGKRTVSQD